MKKRGSVLVNVLIACSLLMLLGSAISIGVINTIKLNQKYSDVIDLELAAKSGLNIFKEELLSEIESVKNGKDLPPGTEEIDSGIDSFDNITITKEIKKEEITVEGTLTGYKYTIISTAKYKADESSEESTLTKTASQVINVNLKNNESSGGNDGNDEGDIGEIEIKPVNFINVKNTIQIQNSSQDQDWIRSKVSAGGEICFKGQDINRNPSEELKKLNISLNDSAIKEIEDSIKVDTDFNIDVDTSIPNIDSSNINQYLNNGKIDISNYKIRFDEINVQDDLVITLNNSTLVIDGDIQSSGNITIIMNGNSGIYTNKIQASWGLNIEINNGKMIVTGDNGILSDYSTIDLAIENSSTLYTNKIQAAKELNIRINKGKMVVTGNNGINSNGSNINLNIENNSMVYTKKIQAQQELIIVMDNGNMSVEGEGIFSEHNTMTLNVKNNSELYSKKVYASSKLNIVINNGKIVIDGYDGIISQNDTIDLNIENNSKLYSKKIQAQQELSIEVMDNGNMVVYGDNGIISNYKTIDINIENNSIVYTKKIQAQSIVDIKMNNYGNIIVEKDIISNYDPIKFTSTKGVCIVNGSINTGFDSSGAIEAELENSAIICMGNFKAGWGIGKLTNKGKSFILILGNEESEIRNLEIVSYEDIVTPNDKNVINTINRYLKIN